MPKKLILFSGITILILITTLIFTFYDTDKKVLKNDKQEQIINSNSITMMYETASGSGEYMVSNDSTWPQDGYVFNERLSGCENGSSLTWDDERKAVILSTLVSDKCYVYFDVEVITLADYIINEVYTGTAKETYEVEVGAKQSGYVETMKIGLMYASDYGYGVSPEKWTTSLGEYNYGADNWLYLGDYEWTISHSANSSIYMGFAFTVKSDYERCSSFLLSRI